MPILPPAALRNIKAGPFEHNELRSFAMMKHLILLAVAAVQHGSANFSPEVEALLAQDRRVASVADRLITANATLCRQTMPVTGFVLQSRDQYPAPAPAALFANGDVAMALVMPGSAAALAGLQPGDAITRVGDSALPARDPADDAPQRDAVFDLIAAAAPVATTITFRRDGKEQTITLQPPAGCRVLVEQRVDRSAGARSNGRVVQVNSGLALQVDDNGLAVVLAHELAHSVLEHRRRLEGLGVAKGFFGEFGRNQQLNRQMEVEADRLSVHLLANAGWDPALAPAFWRTEVGRKVGGGLLRSSTYPSAEGRATLLEQEIAQYLPGGGPTWPDHLLSRRDAAD